jgi:hypothetical protein
MKLIEYTKQVVGIPYCAGGMDPKMGLGCFTIVYNWIKIHMPALPTEYHSYTLENRRQFYDETPEAANALMLQFFDEYLVKVEPAFAFVGDVLWTSLMWKGKEYLAACIHAGNGHMLGATPARGVTLIPIRNYRVLRAWHVQGANR